MFPAATKGGGQNATTGPLDVCKVPGTPPVPTPFPNLGSVSDASGGSCSQKVKMLSKKVCTTKSEIPRSSGDEAGTLGGMVSNVNMNTVHFKQGSSKVIVEGEKCAHMTSMTGHNGSNANVPAGAMIAPSQTVVIVG